MQVYLFDIAPLCNEAAQLFYLPLLTEGQEQKVQQAKTLPEKGRRLGAALLYRQLFGDAAIQKNDYGKPYLKHGPFFNLSHSGQFVCLALGANEMGIDIQQQVSYRTALVKRFFHASEQAWLAQLPAAKRAAAFCRLWSLKEAHCKAIGSGIAHNFSNYHVELSSTPQIFAATQQLPFFFYEYPLNGYHLALCSTKELSPKPLLQIFSLAQIKTAP